MVLNKNEFGRLVRSYREQRGWTQEALANRWGYDRSYVSQIERGRRKLDSVTQVMRLADILNIPSERLEAIGRGIPERKIEVKSLAQADDAILQMLLAPGRDMVRLAYMGWIADQNQYFEDRLKELVITLNQALTAYRGEFLKSAQQLLAYTNQMMGRIAFDHLDFGAASGYFSEMIDLGQELGDPDIVAMGMTYQGSLLRKRGRFETSLRCFERARPSVDTASPAIKGIYHLNMSTLHADAGHEKPFLEAIEAAYNDAGSMKPDMDSIANEFTLEDVQWANASGFSALWKPEEALPIFKELDKSDIFKPLRARGGYIISKGKAYLRAGDLDSGVKLHLEGVKLASEYQSKRHIGWVQDMLNRLRVLPIGQDKRLDALQEALADVEKQQKGW